MNGFPAQRGDDELDAARQGQEEQPAGCAPAVGDCRCCTQKAALCLLSSNRQRRQEALDDSPQTQQIRRLAAD